MKRDRLNFLTTLFNDIFFYEYSSAKTHTYANQYIIGLSKLKHTFWKIERFSFGIYILFPLVALAYILGNAGYSIVYLACHKKKIFCDSKIYLYTSAALPKVVHRSNLYSEDNSWLLLPGMNNVTLKNTYSIYDFIQFRDIIEATFDATVILFASVSHFGIKVCLLSLKAYIWLLYNAALRKLPIQTTLYFCNQKDRWALLIDKLPHKNKILLQHGTEIILSEVEGFCKYIKQYDFWVQKVPYKLSTLSIVYAFTSKEATAISLSIIKNKPTFIYTGYGLHLSDIKSNRFSILLIGCYSINYLIEKEIIRNLQSFDVELYIKNHPTLNPCFYENLKTEYRFNLLDNNSFPKVNLVLSYASTLAFEYESLGVNVLYYEKNSLEELLQKTKDMIHKY